jgi:pimeloyl-ACP methyl ester carboxylesterase
VSSEAGADSGAADQPKNPPGRGTVRAVVSAARAAVVECAWIGTSAALYPLGLSAERVRRDTRYTLRGLSPGQRGLLVSDLAAAGTPILLVHGIIENRSVFTVLRRRLHRQGFGRIRTVNYGPWSADVRSAAARLGDAVARLCADTGAERVHIVGHSLGGILARYYVQRLGGDARVHTVVTLGSPHGGSRAARLLPGGLGRDLRPDSDVVRELAEPAPGCATRFVAVWSNLDHAVVPAAAARIDHPDLQARNLLVRGIGHISLACSATVAASIAVALGSLDGPGADLERPAAPRPGGSSIGGVDGTRATGPTGRPVRYAGAAARPALGPAPKQDSLIS